MNWDAQTRVEGFRLIFAKFHLSTLTMFPILFLP